MGCEASGNKGKVVVIYHRQIGLGIKKGRNWGRKILSIGKKLT